MNIIEEVLSACVSSARAEPIKLRLNNGKFRTIPSQLNVMLLMPSGAGKTTLLTEANVENIVEINDYTYPAIIGTISKQGEVVPGYVMKAAGKCLWIDEFHSLASNSRRALLSLISHQKATRVLGFKAQRPFSTSRTYIKYSIRSNELKIKYARMSVLLSGIFAPHKKKKPLIDDFAFSSRFLPIKLSTTTDEIDDMDEGKRFFNVKETEFEGGQIFEDWVKFSRCYSASVKMLPKRLREFFSDKNEFYRRNKYNLARFVTWKNREESTVTDWEFIVPYIPFFMYSTVASTLTHSEFEVFTLSKEGLSQRKIASKLSVSEAFISKIISKLKGVGLS